MIAFTQNATYAEALRGDLTYQILYPRLAEFARRQG